MYILSEITIINDINENCSHKQYCRCCVRTSQGSKTIWDILQKFLYSIARPKNSFGKRFNYRWPLSRWNFYKKIKEFDLWHYHYPYGSLKKNLEMRRNLKPFLKHYHGDDLRGRVDTDFCLVSTPDLLKYAPNGKWLPNPIDFEGINSILTKISYENKKAKALDHRKVYESNIHSRELELKRSVLVDLEAKSKLVLIPILDLPYKKALDKIADCDIVVGKILPVMGWIGRIELEAMALGKPVIAYVSAELYEKYKPPYFEFQKNLFIRFRVFVRRYKYTK